LSFFGGLPQDFSLYGGLRGGGGVFEWGDHSLNALWRSDLMFLSNPLGWLNYFFKIFVLATSG
jgi:hypothetical protein